MAPALGIHPSADSLPVYDVIGLKVHAVSSERAVSVVEGWIASGRRPHFVSLANVDVAVEARRNVAFREVMASSDLVLPDSMPLFWLSRRSGKRLQQRVYGPTFMLDLIRTTGGRYRHFFYGGAPAVPEALTERLKDQFPELVVAGHYSPPFRPLTRDEKRQIDSMINDARPDILWVGLGAPKQEFWIFEHRRSLQVPAIIAVGQAFDQNSGRTNPAPGWMSGAGLEWLYRLVREPRRLWRRYLLGNTFFVNYLILDLLKSKTE